MTVILKFLKSFLKIFAYQKELINTIIKEDKIFSIFLLLNFIKVVLLTFIILFLLDQNDVRYFEKNREVLFYSILTTFFLVVNFWAIFYRYKKLFFFFYFCQILFYFINISYISYNFDYITVIGYLSLWQEGFSMLSEFFGLINEKTLLLFLDTIPFLFFFQKKQNKKFSSKKCFLFLLFLFSFIALTITVDLLYAKMNIENITRGDSKILLRKTQRRFLAINGFIPYNVIYIFYNLFGNSIINDKSLILSSHAREVVYENEKPLSVTNNFIFIQMESFPAGIIDEKYNGKLVTPFLNQLCKQDNTLYFKYMLTYHGAGHSFDSTFAVINNIEPLREVAQHSLGKNYKINNSLVSVFKEQNKNLEYKAYSFENIFPWFFSARKIAAKMKFDFHYSLHEMSPKKYHDTFVTPDQYMFDFVANRINQKKDSPFFYFMATMSTHMPFTAVQEIYSNENYTPLYLRGEKYLANYLTTLSYADEQLKKFLPIVYKKFPNTYIFIYGDHTLTDTQYPRPEIKKGGLSLEFTPLLMIAPENKKINKKIKSVAFSHDIAATVLPLSELSYRYRLRGHNILKKNFDKTPIHYYELKLDRKKLFNEMENFMKQKKKEFREN